MSGFRLAGSHFCLRCAVVSESPNGQWQKRLTDADPRAKSPLF
ncbi:hypothetical protein [Nocardia abscessus]|nr:hypothetical protein [Nocardia abscessus]